MHDEVSSTEYLSNVSRRNKVTIQFDQHIEILHLEQKKVAGGFQFP